VIPDLVRALSLAVLFVASTLTLGCDPELAPGELGRPRYVANVRGEPPLSLVPPISDRAGNAYVLFGDPDEAETRVWVGHASGGWTASCEVTEGGGVRGWVGRAQDTAYYWSGGALARVSGRHGGCKRLLERDPSTRAALDFVAVIPSVVDAPSGVRVAAWIRSPTDPRPFAVEVDLLAGVYELVGEVGDSGSDFAVWGVGANPTDREGVVVYRFTDGDTTRDRAAFVGARGETIDEVGIEDAPPDAALVGNFVPVTRGRYVGLTSEGRLLLVDGSGGRFRNVDGMTAVGVHAWEDRVYVVGTADKRAVVSRIDESGAQGEVLAWEASRTFGANLDGNVIVTDDRSLPAREVEWRRPRSALGAAPFVSPFSLDPHATGITLWLLAGPDYESGGEPYTAVALVSVGVEYP
jgi:hypothetical protein